MQANMDPLTPTSSTLSPAISHIAETAASLAKSLQARTAASREAARAAPARIDTREKQKQLVKWVLDAPQRLKALIEDRKSEEADAQWQEVCRLLDKWKGVGGVEDVRRQCEQAMAGGHVSSDI